MYPRRFLPHAVLALLLILTTHFILASSMGWVEGLVVDEQTGDPLFGVSIQIEGTNLGAKTDFDGNYLITGVSPGKYTLLVSSIGYETRKITDVKVEANKSTTINVRLKASVLNTGKTTEVRGVKKGIDFLSVGTKMSGVPKPVADESMRRETGITREKDGKQHIRGGRAGEMNYLASPSLCPSQPYPPAHGGTAIVNGQAFDAMFFKNYGVNPFVDTEDDHLSTFAIDVDDASFVMTRSYLERGNLPPDEAVRVEEFVNHFDYGYDAPYREAFTVHFEGSPSRFGQNCSLLRVGIKGMEIPPEMRKPANLVFVIDVSGSMGREDRLGLVKKSLKLLVDELKESDNVGIVVYGSRGQVVLEPTSIRNRNRILNAIEWLHTNGATNAEEGLRLGYEMADRMFEKGKINRIILCSDGVANVGRTGPESILEQIKKYAEKGITLSSIGFGMGNYNDILLEKLGNKGNGSYAYVDDIREAWRIFVANLTGNLQVIARDVKIQFDFNPDVVKSYRLLGYENRDVDDNKFRDDKEDGGEIGAGHSVTALYEIKFHKRAPKSATVGTIYIRYKDPESFEVTEINRSVNRRTFASEFDDCSPSFRLASAAAEFAEILRKSYWAKGSSLKDVMDVAKKIHNQTGKDEVIEFMHLISKADQLSADLAEK